MNPHLSSEQIEAVIAGCGSPDQEQHASTCLQCAAEVARISETLSCFAASVKQWAEHEGGDAANRIHVPMEYPRRRASRLRWAAAAAALILMAALPLYENFANRRQETQALEDSLLLEQVNRHISRPVPAAMERFVDLLVVDESNPTGERHE